MSDLDFLFDIIPGLDHEMAEYIQSLALDDSIDLTERLELLVEYLSSVEPPASSDLDNLATRILEPCDSCKKIAIPVMDTADVVTKCLAVIRAPEVSHAPASLDLDDDLKKSLLRIYDVEDAQATEGDIEIMGLGRNENKLRIVMDREEGRARAKQEQEEILAQRVAQKLKSQADTIKARTVSRKK